MTGGQCIHDLVPDASPPPANEAIVTSGAGTVVLRQVAPWLTPDGRLEKRTCLTHSVVSSAAEVSYSFLMLSMLLIRLAKVAMIGSLAVYAFIVAYDNLVDYGSNYQFVRHVLSMDTTFPGNALMHRAVINESIWRVAYALIIAMEGLTALLLALGAVMLLGRLRAPAEIFNRSKVWAIAGLTVGFALWFFGFMVIAGEYFAMWQSKEWNGQEAAFRITTVILAVLIFVSLPDGDVG